jgi:transcriptional regulator with XRE-family HTH domain
MDPLLKAVGDTVRAARVKRSLSQEKLAALASLDRTYVSSLERGRRNVSLLTLDRIAVALGIPLASLIPQVNTSERAKKFR